MSEMREAATDINTRPEFLPEILSATEEGLAIEPVESLRGVSVVICEDEWATANILSMLMRKAGLEVVAVVSDGESCVREVLRSGPGLVLIDINLPTNTDGIEAAREVLRANPQAKPRVIIITGYADESNRENSKNVGVDGYVIKPFEPGELLDYIRLVMESPADTHHAALGEG